MYLNQNSLQYKHFQDFEKYARFICEKFDIAVELDATRAETDGRVIYLPNVMSMTSKELDMMYAILLHEAGHIRYSTFEESYFKALKSQSHAFLANAIEDGRIENLLMKDFGGANDMFEKLYCDYTQDKVLMKKVFKHDGQKPDLFTTLAFYTHNQIVQCKTSALKEIAGAYRAGRINKFWRDNNVDSLIAQNPLKNDKDVIALTNQIYDLFAKKFKDKSEKLDFVAELKEKKAITKKMDDLKAEGLKVEQQVQELGKKVEEIQQQIEDFENSHPELDGLEEQIRENHGKIEKINSQIYWKNEYDRNVKSLNDIAPVMNKIRSDEQKAKEDQKSLEEKLQKGVSGRGQKPMTQEQKDSLQKRIDSKKSQAEKLQQRLDSQQSKLDALKDVLKDADLNAQADPDRYNKDLDVEAMNTQRDSFVEDINAIQKEINEINAEKVSMINEFNSCLNQIEQVQANFMDKAASAMFDIDKMSGNSDFGLEVLPEMNYEDVWPEAASAQQKFDEKATRTSGKIVRNGQKAAGMFGSNVRDIITFIDKKKIQVEEIDVAQLFKDKINPSKLSDFNTDVKQTNFMDDKSVVGVFGTYREHIPLTTMFDGIKKDHVNNNAQEMNQLIAENTAFYRDLKRVFARKFKFAKKDFWKGGKEDGSLDVRNLWKLPTNQGDDFYEISNPKFVNKTAATILVDISGSQNKEATDYGKKIKSLVMGLSLALDDVHIKHEILGYHAPVCQEMRELEASSIYTRRSNRLETVVYKEMAQKDRSGIMNIEPQMTDNSDGESLKIAIKRLKATRAKSHMIFVVSDGKPFLCDTDVSVLDEDFRDALRKAVREKVQVFGIGFFEQLEHFFGNRFCNATNNNEVLKFFDKTNFQ